MYSYTSGYKHGKIYGRRVIKFGSKLYVCCYLSKFIRLLIVDSDVLWGRSERAWRAAPDAQPADDELDPPNEVILPELPSTLINFLLSTTFTSVRLVYSSVLGVTREICYGLCHTHHNH